MSFNIANKIRRLNDANLQLTQALPAAAASNYSSFLDLGSERLGAVADDIEVEVIIPALASLADAHALSLTPHDSADGATSAALSTAPVLTVTGGGGVGAAAATFRFKLPPLCRRYIRFAQAVPTGGGDNTASSVTYKVHANAPA